MHNLRVAYILPLWDIAILEPEDKDQFWSNHKGKGLMLAEKAEIGSEIFVHGYPLRDNITCNEGIISGFKYTTCSHTDNLTYTWSMNISAILNNGNSGGPVVNKDGKVVGIISQSTMPPAIINFAIPLVVIKTSLHKYLNKLSPYIPFNMFYWQELEQPLLKKCLHLPEEISGCRITQISQYSNYYPNIQVEDVLHQIDEHIILDNCQVLIDNYLVPLSFLFQLKSVGERLNIILYRNGQRIQTSIVICEKSSQTFLIGLKTTEDLPTYLVYNGLVIMPAILDACWAESQNHVDSSALRSPQNLENVIILRILSCKHTRAILDDESITGRKIVEINGQAIRCIWDCINILEQENYENFLFKLNDNSIICLPKMTSEDQLMLTQAFNINKFRSDDLLPQNKAQYFNKFPERLQINQDVNALPPKS